MPAPQFSVRSGAVGTVLALVVALLLTGAPGPASGASAYQVWTAASKTLVVRGTPVTISGSVGPSAAGHTVVLQQYAGRWTSVASAKLSSTSHYSFRKAVPLGSTAFRVTKAASSTRAAGTSKVVRVVGVKPGFSSVTSGPGHTCALKYDHTLWCFGSNFDGQLGLGTTKEVPSLRRIGTSSWLWVKAGWFNTCGVRTDRTMWCTGHNEDGGAIAGPGRDAYHFTQMGTRHDWAEVTPGSYGGCGRTTGQVALCWGKGWHGADGTDTWTPYPVAYANWLRVASGPRGDAQGCGIRLGDLLWCFHENSSLEPSPYVLDSSRWASLESGYGQSCGLHTAKSLWCWGDSTYGQSGPGPTSDTPQHVAAGSWRNASAGYQFSCGVRSDGTAWCWGSNEYGKLGTGSYSPATSHTPLQVGSWTTWAVVDAGYDSACGIRTDGALFCWGMVTAPGEVADPDLPAPTHNHPVRMG
ncbi:RCC1 domain-containing protein [Nocardioides marmorisolisilvae]|uniref:Chromosome condensation regulator RCC1 n=1 Tax=Nocardioides marmorisolisilvae TaxID=1542737 RepID=A0A3N0DVX2_9ACTN|nr:RCC1 domain-containing protein [Nocardioides marmorisolisilvae]RNL79770.1 hypothetical protein EFL95_12515 [Nocardioides marmorisolisilvae]